MVNETEYSRVLALCIKSNLYIQRLDKQKLYDWESVAGSVIQVTGTEEFEDGLLEDGSPLWKLLVTLWQPHLS